MLPLSLFCQGWGPKSTYESLQRILGLLKEKNALQSLIRSSVENVQCIKEFQDESTQRMEYSFKSPIVAMQPGLLEGENQFCRFQLVLPKHRPANRRIPVCIQLASTNEHDFSRRSARYATPLAQKHNVASILVENPFYGRRKPSLQRWSSLLHVSDLLVMGCCLLLECSFLLNWCDQINLGPACLFGISLGGQNASLAGTIVDRPVAIVPCLCWTSATPAFDYGVYGYFVISQWKILAKQLQDDPSLESLLSRFTLDVPKPCTQPKHQLPFWAQFLNGPLAGPLLQCPPQNHSVYQRLSSVIEYYTNIRQFPTPHPGSSVIYLVASNDRCFPNNTQIGPDEIWPGTEVRYINGGHVTGIYSQHDEKLNAVLDAFKRLPPTS